MSPLVPDHIAALSPYVPGKPIETLERELGVSNAIKLASNENLFGAAPAVHEAIVRAATDVHYYPDATQHRLREALAGSLDVPMDHLMLGNGSNEIIDLLPKTLVGAGEHVVFGAPSFVCYELACRSANVAYTAVPLVNHLAWDIDAMLAAVTPKTRLLFVAHPNNPTGAHVPRVALEKLLREAPSQVTVVVDEAYVEYGDADDFVSALELRGLRERLIVLRTFSKAYGLSGIRVGFGVATAEMTDFYNRVRAPFNVNAIAQEAAIAALGATEHLQRTVAETLVQRSVTRDALEGAGFEVAPSQTNFLLVNVAAPGRSVYDGMLQKGVITRPMPAPIDTWLRITVGPRAINERMIEALVTTCSQVAPS